MNPRVIIANGRIGERHVTAVCSPPSGPVYQGSSMGSREVAMGPSSLCAWGCPSANSILTTTVFCMILSVY